MLCNAQRFTMNKGGIATKNYLEKIPYEYINGRIFVTVEINGKPRRFFLDTGAPTQISPELFSELKLSIIKNLDIGDISGKSDSVKVTTLPEIKLQGLSFTGVPALIFSGDIYQCWHIDGVIGANVLSKSIVHIDPDEHTITITDDIKKIPVNKKMLATMLTDEAQGSPFIVVWITPKKTQLVGFDTGDPDFFIATNDFIEKFKKNNAFTKISSGYGMHTRGLFGVPKPDSVYRLKLPSIELAGHTFTNVITETNEKQATSMGTKILDYGTVTLDYIHHIFYYEAKTDTTNMAEKKWPIAPMPVGNKLLAGAVWKEMETQVKWDDQVIAINDKPYETVDFCEWLNRVPTKIETVTLTIKDANGNVRKVTMVKQ